MNLRQLVRLPATDLNPDTLHAAGLIARPHDPVKLLAIGEADRPYSVRGIALSAAARAKIEAAGGRVEG